MKCSNAVIDFDEDPISNDLITFLEPETKDILEEPDKKFYSSNFGQWPKKILSHKFPVYTEQNVDDVSTIFYETLKDDFEEENEEQLPITYTIFKEKMAYILRDPNHWLKVHICVYALSDI